MEKTTINRVGGITAIALPMRNIDYKGKDMSNDKPKLAAVYCRVSTSDQADNGLSIESQEAVCSERAVKDGYKILEVIKDEGRSGGTLKRSGIQQVIKLVSEKAINALYVIHGDRLARNTADHLALRDLLRKNDVILNCIYQPVMDDSATSRTMDTIMASFNEMQRLITAEKVIGVMSEKAKLGYFPSMAPIGYRNVLNPNQTGERASKRIIVPNPAIGSFVTKAFELYATGNYNVFDLIDILYEQGMRTKSGGKIAHSRMYEMLRNRFYIGEVHWRNIHVINGRHEPLVAKGTFERVQQILRTHNRKICRKRKYKWLLAGFVRCHKHGICPICCILCNHTYVLVLQ